MEQARKLEFLLDDLGVDGADACDGTILNTTYIAEKILEAGWTLPVRCKDCKRFKDGYCMIRKDSWGGALERGEHDFCSDGERKEE